MEKKKCCGVRCLHFSATTIRTALCCKATPNFRESHCTKTENIYHTNTRMLLLSTHTLIILYVFGVSSMWSNLTQQRKQRKFERKKNKYVRNI